MFKIFEREHLNIYSITSSQKVIKTQFTLAIARESENSSESSELTCMDAHFSCSIWYVLDEHLKPLMTTEQCLKAVQDFVWNAPEGLVSDHMLPLSLQCTPCLETDSSPPLHPSYTGTDWKVPSSLQISI